MKRNPMSDAELSDEIREVRDILAVRLPAGSCLGRRIAIAHLEHLEAEMVRRYEVEMWGCDRG